MKYKHGLNMARGKEYNFAQRFREIVTSVTDRVGLSVELRIDYEKGIIRHSNNMILYEVPEKRLSQRTYLEIKQAIQNLSDSILTWITQDLSSISYDYTSSVWTLSEVESECSFNPELSHPYSD